jgi:methionyl-tRNA formyltransferase
MTQPELRIVFAGTPDFAANHLSALISDGFKVVSAYSQPDRPAGRGKQVQPTAVKAVALAHGIDVHQPLSLDSPNEIDRLLELQPDVLVVVAYGLLLPKAVLTLPVLGCLNVHASLLPRWRGAAPIERAILAGDTESGVSIMQMDEGLDTGPVLAKRSTPISPQDNSQTLGARLNILGCQALCEILRTLPEHKPVAEPQDDALACYARKISKTEALVDWTVPASRVNLLARALYPRSPAYTLHLGKRLRLIETEVIATASASQPGTVTACYADSVDIACGQNSLRILRVQLEGRGEMSVADLLNGHRGYFSKGQRLGES